MLNAFSEFGVLRGLAACGRICRSGAGSGRNCRFAGAVCAWLPLFLWLLLVPLSLSAGAQGGSFPYEARVAAEETFARSGGGDAYYPTQRLTRGTVVRVHRHDPGGWYVIEPPEGSFSWIPERFVKRLSEQEGEVLEENVVASVGSEFGDETSVFQRRMKKGEKVSILGQRSIDTATGAQAMLKIRPPMRERRWAPGAALVPVDPDRQRQADNDPWRLPANGRRATAMATPAAASLPAGLVEVPLVEPSEALQKVQQDKGEKQQLAELDQRFREMVLQDAATWDLDSLEGAYRELQGRLTNPQISGAVELRYGAIQRYRQRLAELLQVRQLQSQTEQRDAALAARHGFASMMPGAVPSVQVRPPQVPSMSVEPAGPRMITPSEGGLLVEGSGGSAAVAEGDGFVAPTPDATMPPTDSRSALLVSQSREVPGQGGEADGSDEALFGTAVAGSAGLSAAPAAAPVAAPAAETGSSDNVIRPGSPQNKYVGAGVIQRAQGVAGGWVLASPSGRLLADLKPAAGVQLERFAGREVGVLGMRWSQKEQRDVIEVRGLEPVQLRR